MARDQIYAGEHADEAPFEFSEAVAEVFPDMLERSIPGYADSIRGIGSLARRYVKAGSRCYDLGCSLGAATLAMRHNITASGCRIIAIDNAPAMAARCRAIVAEDDGEVAVEVICGDVLDAEIADASMVVMNYTLQFLQPADRASMVQRIADGMRPGGLFILSEKVVHNDPAIDAMLVELHHDFKRRHAYSDLEISRKRAALENVLIPDDIATHEQRLEASGFQHVGIWLKNLNFASFAAIR